MGGISVGWGGMRSPLHLGALLLVLSFRHATSGAHALTALDVCEEFSPGDHCEAMWSLDECVELWTTWSLSIHKRHHTEYGDRRVLRATADEMRRRGNPCLVDTLKTFDGVGSSMTRQIAAWLYAAEVGCDWVHPDFDQGNVSTILTQQNTPSVYCHELKRLPGFDRMAPLAESATPRRCVRVSWILYFNLHKVSVPPILPDVKVEQIEVSPTVSAMNIKKVVDEIEKSGWDNLPWTRLQLVLTPQKAGHYAVTLNSWDAFKRATVRDALRRMRDNFHDFPRSGFDSNPVCPYDRSRLNFAIHVRLGDRKTMNSATAEYFRLLEDFMDTVSAAVVGQGEEPPLFHVFSETQQPCPSHDTRAFDEFPDWPVEPDQIPACLEATVPDDCLEKRSGGDKCFAKRSGVFRVQGRPIVLNLDPDAVNTLSCMIMSDGVLMGCSTFGEVAGLFSKGLKFFSVSCEGRITWEPNKLFPALAVAELGDMWVPVGGSWRDPVLKSTKILNNVLHNYIQNKRESTGD